MRRRVSFRIPREFSSEGKGGEMKVSDFWKSRQLQPWLSALNHPFIYYASSIQSHKRASLVPECREHAGRNETYFASLTDY
jgi:hypothetical protein